MTQLLRTQQHIIHLLLLRLQLLIIQVELQLLKQLSPLHGQLVELQLLKLVEQQLIILVRLQNIQPLYLQIEIPLRL